MKISGHVKTIGKGFSGLNLGCRGKPRPDRNISRKCWALSAGSSRVEAFWVRCRMKRTKPGSYVTMSQPEGRIKLCSLVGSGPEKGMCGDCSSNSSVLGSWLHHPSVDLTETDLEDTLWKKNETIIHQKTTSVTTSDCSPERQVRTSGDPLTSNWSSQICSWLIPLPDTTPTHLTFDDAAFLRPAHFLC